MTREESEGRGEAAEFERLAERLIGDAPIKPLVMLTALLEARAEIARLREAMQEIAGECGCSIARAALAPRDAKQGDA